jgi:Cdc6-like AAA superfamily ATPase
MINSIPWKDWLDCKTRFLWIYGIPGAGKTILLSYLVKETQDFCNEPLIRRKGYAYFYCYHGRNHDETKHFLRWILNQLCRQAQSIPTTIYALHRHGEEPTDNELLDALEAILGEFDSVFVLIDALDESQNREHLLNILRTIVTNDRFKKIQLLATSRPEIGISRVLRPITVATSMSNSLADHDIRIYINSKLHSDPKFTRWPSALLQEVEDALKECKVYKLTLFRTVNS